MAINKQLIKEKHSWLKNFLRHRQHPIKIINYTSKNIWLMLIPLAKYLIATKFDFQSWIRANWLDMLVITGIFAFAVFKWIFVYYEIDDDGIIAHSGLFGISTTKVYFSEITTFSCTQSYIYNAVNACTMFVETNADSVPKTDIKLVLSEKCVNEIYDIVTAQGTDKPKFSISPKKSYLVFFSFLFSSALSGMLLYATFMFEVYRLVGKEMEEQLLRRVNGEITRIDTNFLKLTNTVPKAILILGGAVVGSWLLSFIANLMRHWNFTATRCGGQYIIKSGFLTKRKHVINRDKINFLDLQQTLLMRICKINAVTLYCTGYGKGRREISALIPITTTKNMYASLKILYPNFTQPKAEVKTGLKDLSRFVLIPVLLCFLPSAAGTATKLFIDKWHTEINIIMAVGIIPLVWLVAVQARAAFTTSMGFKNGICTLTYCPAYQFHNIIIPKENISKLMVSRNIFQRSNGTCTLKIYTNSESVKFHKVKSLPFDKVRDICLREGFFVAEM